MADSSAYAHFWYPQLASTGKTSVVTEALKAFCALFSEADREGGRVKFEETTLQSAGAGDLFNLEGLLTAFEDVREPICVIGTCGKEKAVEESWRQLGLNLFELPWNDSRNSFRYLQATALFKDIDALENLLGYRRGVPNEDGRGTLADLRWAQSHRFQRAVQKAVGHGERNVLHTNEERFKDDLNSLSTRVRKKPWHEGDHGAEQAAGVIESISKQESEGEEWRAQARRLANLDPRHYRLAPAVSYQPDGATNSLLYVVAIEDHSDVVQTLVDDLRAVYGFDEDEQLNKEEYSACGIPTGGSQAVYVFRRKKGDQDDEGSDDTNDNAPLDSAGPGSSPELLIIEFAHIEKSLEQQQLCDGSGEKGKPILERLTTKGLPFLDHMERWLEQQDAETDLVRELVELLRRYEEPLQPHELLVCLDLELYRRRRDDPKEVTPPGEVYGGHWLLYATARLFPHVPRLIITGFRSEALRGHAAGGRAYLTKPYPTSLLGERITEARAGRCVYWVCPQHVRDNYGSRAGDAKQELLDGLTFEACFEMLRDWLSMRNVTLEVRDSRVPEEGEGEQLSDQEVAESHLIVLDLFETPSPGEPVPDQQDTFDLLLQQITQIRSIKLSVPLVVVLPIDMEADVVFSACYQRLPLRLHDGFDTVVQKPMWLVADGHPDPDAALSSVIVRQFGLETLDVKYQVIIPVAAIIGRLDGAFVQMVQGLGGEQPEETWDQFYAPLLPALIQRFGLAGPIRDLADATAKFEVREALVDYIRRAQDEEEDRWAYVSDETVVTAVAASVEFVQHELINHHATLEAWLRRAVDEKARQETEGKAERLDEFLKPLVRVFGGSTRYEFTVNGSWYSGEGHRIDDLLIVIEFGARSSLAARAFVEATVVEYLLTIAEEQAVMVQEIPIRGYFY